MTPSRSADRELDSLIDEITIDCYGEDEALMGFENAFDEHARFPCRGTIIGEAVKVISVGPRNGRRELIATCEHHGRRHDIALLDIDVRADPTTARLTAAYRRWLSAQDGAT